MAAGGIYLTPRFPRNKVFISASCDHGLPLRAAALASTDPRGGERKRALAAWSCHLGARTARSEPALPARRRQRTRKHPRFKRPGNQSHPSLSTWRTKTHNCAKTTGVLKQGDAERRDFQHFLQRAAQNLRAPVRRRQPPACLLLCCGTFVFVFAAQMC